MADRNPERAIAQIKQIERACDFLENPVIKTALELGVPRPVPPAPGALGFDIPLWVGLGIVGVWAALDAFAERAALPSSPPCPTCGRPGCILAKFGQTPEAASLAELEDLRHLYAHNYGGEADSEYFNRARHVLKPGTVVSLTCGAQFDGQRVQLDLPHLRGYSQSSQKVLSRFS
jgi:hypothetical protein